MVQDAERRRPRVVRRYTNRTRTLVQYYVQCTLYSTDWTSKKGTSGRTFEQIAQLVDVAGLHHFAAELLVERQVEHQAQHEPLQVHVLVGQQLEQKRHDRSLLLCSRAEQIKLAA